MWTQCRAFKLNILTNVSEITKKKSIDFNFSYFVKMTVDDMKMIV